MTHDPLCPTHNCIAGTSCDECCQCDLITKVRSDERNEAVKRMSAFINTRNFPIGVVSATEWAVHAVRATPFEELPERLRATLDD